jgi:tetratricopeptide (TPR) repeat protein
MGVAYDELKEYNKAIQVYQKAIEINPQKYGVYGNMWNTYEKI